MSSGALRASLDRFNALSQPRRIGGTVRAADVPVVLGLVIGVL